MAGVLSSLRLFPVDPVTIRERKPERHLRLEDRQVRRPLDRPDHASAEPDVPLHLPGERSHRLGDSWHVDKVHATENLPGPKVLDFDRVTEIMERHVDPDVLVEGLPFLRPPPIDPCLPQDLIMPTVDPDPILPDVKRRDDWSPDLLPEHRAPLPCR